MTNYLLLNMTIHPDAIVTQMRQRKLDIDLPVASVKTWYGTCRQAMSYNCWLHPVQLLQKVRGSCDLTAQREPEGLLHHVSIVCHQLACKRHLLQTFYPTVASTACCTALSIVRHALKFHDARPRTNKHM